MDDTERPHEEIIIVRRPSDHDEGHHGGVWKIAFADFMTAMMAFFLVMWLINASNEETKKAVASYFNPIELMDTTTNPKGVKNPKYGVPEEGEDTDQESTVVSTPPKSLVDNQGAGESFDEQALFVDPYAVLSEIAGGLTEEEADDSTSEGGDGNPSKGIGIRDGVAFQDPFDPMSWSVQFGAPADPLNDLGEGEREDGRAAAGSLAAERDSELDDLPAVTDVAQPAAAETDAETGAETGTETSAGTTNGRETESGTAKVASSMTPATSTEAESPADPADPEALALTEALRSGIDEILKQAEAENLDVEVSKIAGGSMITLSDQSAAGMFEIGSARPTPELVRVMGAIGGLIEGKAAQVTISGHTDGRQYKSRNYDNWRLSSSRAHMAYYMLVRGGLDQGKVEKIEGHADKMLKLVDDPLSSANRRIEVYVRRP